MLEIVILLFAIAALIRANKAINKTEAIEAKYHGLLKIVNDDEKLKKLIEERKQLSENNLINDFPFTLKEINILREVALKRSKQKIDRNRCVYWNYFQKIKLSQCVFMNIQTKSLFITVGEKTWRIFAGHNVIELAYNLDNTLCCMLIDHLEMNKILGR